MWMLKESAVVRDAAADGYSCVCMEVMLQTVQERFGKSLASERRRFTMLGDEWSLYMEGGEVLVPPFPSCDVFSTSCRSFSSSSAAA